MKGDSSGPKSARLVLREPGVEAAVLEVARGGILRDGLGFDRCDVGAVLNVSADHLGLKGVETIEDLANAKAVVVESVSCDGWSILNADNQPSADLERHAGGGICWFSLRGEPDWPNFLRRHIAEGGRAVTCETDAGSQDIVIHDAGDRLFLLDAAKIPATFGGIAEFNVGNALAAVAMAFARDVPIEAIRAGLSAFSTSFEDLPGRLNLFEGHDFTTIVDYAHNPDGLSSLGRFLQKFRRPSQRVVGLVGVPGDRREVDIRQMGTLARSLFDLLVLREDSDLRGRAPGEVAGLLQQGALSAGSNSDRITTVLPEANAVAHCLSLAKSGDLVVLIADDVEAVWRQVLEYSPVLIAGDPLQGAVVRKLKVG